MHDATVTHMRKGVCFRGWGSTAPFHIAQMRRAVCQRHLRFLFRHCIKREDECGRVDDSCRAFLRATRISSMSIPVFRVSVSFFASPAVSDRMTQRDSCSSNGTAYPCFEDRMNNVTVGHA